MIRVLRKKMYPDASDECVLCRGGEEDCEHLFFYCPFARTIWATQGISLSDAIYKMNFGTQYDEAAIEGRRRANTRCNIGNMVTLKWGDVEGEIGFYRQHGPRGRGTNGILVSLSLIGR